MRAIVLNSFTGLGGLELSEVTDPTPGDGEELVNVRAAALGPWDRAATDGRFAAMGGSSEFPQVASTLPVGGLTARLLVEAAGVSEGDSVLVTGAAGMVGGFASQLAQGRGARVVAAVRDPDADEARRLGAETVVDTGSDLEAAELAARASAGELTLRVAETLPLERFRDAYMRLERGGLRGKIVLVP